MIPASELNKIVTMWNDSKVETEWKVFLDDLEHRMTVAANNGHMGTRLGIEKIRYDNFVTTKDDLYRYLIDRGYQFSMDRSIIYWGL